MKTTIGEDWPAILYRAAAPPVRAFMTAWLVLIPAIGWSQEALESSAPPDATAHRHLGFFFHFRVGAGYFLNDTNGGTFSGLSIPFALALGGAVTENLIVAPEVGAAYVHAPHAAVPGARSSYGGWGVNVTYYFMPVNVYISASPSYVHLSSSYDGCRLPKDKCTTPPAYFLEFNTFGMRTAVGKEWWISTHWGAGVALEFFFTVSRTVDSASGNAFAGALTVGVTCN